MEEKLQKIADDFLERIKKNLPAEKADKPFIVGIIGMIGSGKTAFCKELVAHLKGAVLVSSNDSRFLLKEKGKGMGWGDNVRESTFYVARKLIEDGYTIIFDGNHIEREKRINTQKIADELGVKFHLLRINVSRATAEKRIDEKHSKKHENRFGDYWPATDAEDAKVDLRKRVHLYPQVDQEDPKPEFFAEIDNEGTIEEFKQKAREVAEKLEG